MNLKFSKSGLHCTKSGEPLGIQKRGLLVLFNIVLYCHFLEEGNPVLNSR